MRPYVIPVPDLTGAGVEGHSHAYWSNTRIPPFEMQIALGGECSIHVLLCKVEGSAKGIAYPSENDAPSRFDGTLKYGIMALDSGLHRRGISFPAFGAALDICVQEGDGP